MHTYCKLNDGRVMVVWGENSAAETYDVYPVRLVDSFDPAYDEIETVSYEQVEMVDSNRAGM